MGDLNTYLKSYGLQTSEVLDNYHLLAMMVNACFTQQFGLFTYVLSEFKVRFADELTERQIQSAAPTYAGQYSYKTGVGIYQAKLRTVTTRAVPEMKFVEDTGPVIDKTSKYSHLDELYKPATPIQDDESVIDGQRDLIDGTEVERAMATILKPKPGVQVLDGYGLVNGHLVPAPPTTRTRGIDLHILPETRDPGPTYRGVDGNVRFVYPPPITRDDAVTATDSAWAGIDAVIGDSPNVSEDDSDDDEYYDVVDDVSYEIVVKVPTLYPADIDTQELYWELVTSSNIISAVGSVAQNCYGMPDEAFQYLTKISGEKTVNYKILQWTYYCERRMLMLLASMTSSAYIEHKYGGNDTEMNHLLRLSSEDDINAMVARWGISGANPIEFMSSLALIANVALTADQNSNNYFIGEGDDDADRFCSFKEVAEYDPTYSDDAMVAILETYQEMNTSNGDPITDPSTYAGNVTSMEYVGDLNYFTFSSTICDINQYCVFRYPAAQSKFTNQPIIFNVMGTVCSYIDQSGSVFVDAELKTVDSVITIDSVNIDSGVNTTQIGAVSILDKDGFLNGTSVSAGTKVICVAPGALILQSDLFRGTGSIDTLFVDKGKKLVGDGWWLTSSTDKQIVSGEKIDIVTTRIFDCGALIRYISGATIEIEDPVFPGITSNLSKILGLRFMPSTIREVEPEEEEEKKEDVVNRFERQYNETILGCFSNVMDSMVTDLKRSRGIKNTVLEKVMIKNTQEFIKEAKHHNRGLMRKLNDYTKPSNIKDRDTDKKYAVLDDIRGQLVTLQEQDQADKYLLEASRAINKIDLTVDKNAEREWRSRMELIEANQKAVKSRIYRRYKQSKVAIQNSNDHLRQIAASITKEDIEELLGSENDYLDEDDPDLDDTMNEDDFLQDNEEDNMREQLESYNKQLQMIKIRHREQKMFVEGDSSYQNFNERCLPNDDENRLMLDIPDYRFDREIKEFLKYNHKSNESEGVIRRTEEEISRAREEQTRLESLYEMQPS